MKSLQAMRFWWLRWRLARQRRLVQRLYRKSSKADLKLVRAIVMCNHLEDRAKWEGW